MFENRWNSLKVVWEPENSRESSLRDSKIFEIQRKSYGNSTILVNFRFGDPKSPKFVENREGLQELLKILPSKFENQLKSPEIECSKIVEIR